MHVMMTPSVGILLVHSNKCLYTVKHYKSEFLGLAEMVQLLQVLVKPVFL